MLTVWDTVAALGIPIKWIDIVVDKVPIFRHKFQDMRFNDSIEHGRHALSNDDQRLTFHPQIWDSQINSRQTMKQVWFNGMHTDVGGGYQSQDLSDIALGWMVKEAMQQGLRLYPRNRIVLKPNQDGKMNDSRSGLGRLYRRRPRSWDSETHGRPTVHESVVLRDRNPDNIVDPDYKPWILKSPFELESWPNNMRVEGRLWWY